MVCGAMGPGPVTGASDDDFPLPRTPDRAARGEAATVVHDGALAQHLRPRCCDLMLRHPSVPVHMGLDLVGPTGLTEAPFT
jgi:hypothetical protein